ncbi:MAG: hypothetical protein QOE97_2475 [Pseudonocardiales bacterium]|jgi:uncharacterized membrane protein YphA (DoxX/SURF4 family)|nr:hypothetical protein [Pseudonocardiales bacterium]
MSLTAKIRRAPVRAVTGAYILSSGIDKLQAGEETAKGLHGFATTAYPQFEKIEPTLFVRGLGIAEVTVGGILLLPVASPLIAGAGLMAFSGGLLTLYWRTPGMRRGPTDPRPSQDGVPLAKDLWMLGIGASLLIDAILDNARDKRIELTHDLSQSTAVRRERVRTAQRAARKVAKARAAEARANVKAVAAGPAAKADAYLNTAKGMAKAAKAASAKVADVVS